MTWLDPAFFARLWCIIFDVFMDENIFAFKICALTNGLIIA